ncbi:tetratricopeptide repeat protein [Thermodesulfobacteriota bacterium]
MSLMNDALRKKKNESKHPSGTDFFKDDSERKTKNRVRIYGIAAIVLLVCAMAGFYLYEMISLSQPMSPALQSPLVSEPRVSPPGEPVSSVQDSSMPASSETALSLESLPEKQVTPSKTTVMEPTLPALEPEAGKAVPATALLKTASQPPPEKMQKSTLPERIVPPPVIEPEEISPPPEAAGDTNLNQTEKTVTPINTGTDPVEELFYQKGLSYHRQNKLEMAIQMYQAVLKKNPDHRSTRFNLASAYIQVAAYMEARTILIDLNRQEPENPEILLNLAVVEIGLDRPEDALAFLDSAEKRVAAPTFKILFHKGAAHSRMGDFETALSMYQKAERLAPGNPRLWLNTAIVYDSLAQYDQAIDHYQFILGGNTFLTTTERREIETRVRELKAYLLRKENPN